MAETPKKETVEVVLKNWRAEVETAQVYRDLAARESDEKRRGILIRMAEAEERHARRWEQKLREMDEPVPVLTENIWTRFKRRFTRSLGTDIAIRRMEAAEGKNEGEVYEAEIAREKAEVEENPEEEIEEMALFYQLQGFSAEESQKMAERLAENPDQLVQAMAQSELGLSEHRFPTPWKSAASASVSTAVGAFIPIIPFFFMTGLPAVIVAFVVSIVAHFAVGAIKSLITIRSWWASGFEMTLVGVLEAVVTYGLGLAFGAAV